MIQRVLTLGTSLAVGISLAACGSSGSGLPTAGSTATSSTARSAQSVASDIVYSVSPHVRFAASDDLTQPARDPFPAPSVCQKAFGVLCYTPDQLRRAYNVPSSLTGAGQTIVVVDAFGSPTAANDLARFSATFGLPPAQLNIIYPGGSPVVNTLADNNSVGWAEETSLDIEYAHAIAPGATIDLVIADSNFGRSLANAEKYAIDNRLGNVMTMSFGAPEDGATGHPFKAHVAQVNEYYVQAVANGMSIFASSGDGGADEGDPSPTALFPASDPHVTAVGGTFLSASDSGVYQSEVVWNDSYGATGGAPSIIYNAPAYQNADKHAARTTSDVSYNAAVTSSVLVYFSFLQPGGAYYFFGGTSAGAPQWAAIAALADQAAGSPLGELNPKLYPLAGTPAFHDVTSGNNLGFNAGPGYDLPTGIGSPNAANLIMALTGVSAK